MMLKRKWYTFDEIQKQKGHKRAKRNYIHNASIGIRKNNISNPPHTDFIKSGDKSAVNYSNIATCRGKTILRFQNGGTFPSLKFARARMSNVICECMATYNALKLSGQITDDVDFKQFFKLSCEFEVNAPYIISSGFFGSDYRKIGLCLQSRNVDYSVFSDIQSFENSLKENICGIVSYRFGLVRIHTFCCYYENGSFVSVNRGSSCLYEWKNDSIKECLSGGKMLAGYVINK